MSKEKVTLEVKSGWKIFQILSGIVALGGMGLLMKGLINMPNITGTESYILIAFLALFTALISYSVVYSYRHNITFDTSGLSSKGILKKRVISYSDISELRFSSNFWQISATGKILGDNNAIFIDLKYKNAEEAVAFLKEVLNFEETKLVEA